MAFNRITGGSHWLSMAGSVRDVRENLMSLMYTFSRSIIRMEIQGTTPRTGATGKTCAPIATMISTAGGSWEITWRGRTGNRRPSSQKCSIDFSAPTSPNCAGCGQFRPQEASSQRRGRFSGDVFPVGFRESACLSHRQHPPQPPGT